MTPTFAGDTLLHRERTFELIDQPLEYYFQLIGTRPSFEPVSTHGRGYAARWVIEDGWLFLADMSARWTDDDALQLKHMFPFAGSKVFASWYTGKVRGYRRDRPLPDLSAPGQLMYPDLTLDIDHGRISNSVIQGSVSQHGRTPADNPEATGTFEELIF
jgi:hypothetical protein